MPGDSRTLDLVRAYLIHECVARARTSTWDEFAAPNADLFDPALLERIYARGELKGDLSRRVFLFPTPREP